MEVKKYDIDWGKYYNQVNVWEYDSVEEAMKDAILKQGTEDFGITAVLFDKFSQIEEMPHKEYLYFVDDLLITEWSYYNETHPNGVLREESIAVHPCDWSKGLGIEDHHRLSLHLLGDRKDAEAMMDHLKDRTYAPNTTVWKNVTMAPKNLMPHQEIQGVYK